MRANDSHNPDSMPGGGMQEAGNNIFDIIEMRQRLFNQEKYLVDPTS